MRLNCRNAKDGSFQDSMGLIGISIAICPSGPLGVACFSPSRDQDTYIRRRSSLYVQDTMASPMASIPPLDKMFMIGIWIETLLYGVSCVVFTTAIYVLIYQRPSQTRSIFLIVVSCLLFLLSTVHVGIVLRQLLEAFIYAPPGTAILYFEDQSSRLPVAKLVLYSVNVFTQDMVLIWRLWIVWGRNWKIAVVPLILEFIHTAFGFIAEARGAVPGIPVFDRLLHTYALVNWSTDLVVNICVTAGIAYKLWSVGNNVASLSGRKTNKYRGAVLTIIECGGLFTSATFATFCLYLSGQIATVMALDSVMQLATMAPLLIIVRVSLGVAHGSSNATSSYNITAASNVHRGPQSYSSSQVHVKIQKTTESGFELAEMNNADKIP
ncbi:hypothetical protein B0H14DRAFT_2912233 [Mycena olivaceomarginata]|nr:hypothetical protein B0H14DRAFT_2912233 [Mycena olivaceomarginata]